MKLFSIIIRTTLKRALFAPLGNKLFSLKNTSSLFSLMREDFTQQGNMHCFLDTDSNEGEQISCFFFFFFFGGGGGRGDQID